MDTQHKEDIRYQCSSCKKIMVNIKDIKCTNCGNRILEKMRSTKGIEYSAR